MCLAFLYKVFNANQFSERAKVLDNGENRIVGFTETFIFVYV